MMLCDWQIAGLIRERGMIEPAVLHQVREVEDESGSRRVVSYGLSSAGYDVRLGDTFLAPRLQATDPHAEQRYNMLEYRASQLCIIAAAAPEGATNHVLVQSRVEAALIQLRDIARKRIAEELKWKRSV